MILIVGLGNPGKEYENTPHNMGRMAVLRWRVERGLSEFRLEKKFNALAVSGEVDGKSVTALLPETFMNVSGKAVSSYANFYKIESSDIWVLHDDIDLPLGKVRISFDGGSAGHHGVESVAEKLGTVDFWRFRIGIAPKDPPTLPLDAYVLAKNAIGSDAVDAIVGKATLLLTAALREGIAEAQKQSD